MRLINVLVFCSLLLSQLLLAGCRSCNEAENYPNDALVLIDSLPIDDTLSAYIYAFNSGVIGGYGSSFFSIAKSSKSISYSSACFRTNSYSSMKLIGSDTLLVQLFELDVVQLLPSRMHLKFKLTNDGDFVYERKWLYIYPYR